MGGYETMAYGKIDPRIAAANQAAAARFRSIDDGLQDYFEAPLAELKDAVDKLSLQVNQLREEVRTGRQRGFKPAVVDETWVPPSRRAAIERAMARRNDEAGKPEPKNGRRKRKVRRKR